ncbi:MAG: hypothetical protein FWB93_06165 [Oscillospiraceae bacterium]|nr:hypothetical protein [Oscillospiraceae bacterium]
MKNINEFDFENIEPFVPAEAPQEPPEEPEQSENFSDLLQGKRKKKKTKSDRVATVLATLIALFLFFQFGSGVIRLFTQPGIRDVEVSQNIFGNRYIVVSHSRLISYFFRATMVDNGDDIRVGEYETRPNDGFMGQYVMRIMFHDIGSGQTIPHGEWQLERIPRQMDEVNVLVSVSAGHGMNIYVGSDTPMRIVSAGERARFLRGSTRIRIG